MSVFVDQRGLAVRVGEPIILDGAAIERLRDMLIIWLRSGGASGRAIGRVLGLSHVAIGKRLAAIPPEVHDEYARGPMVEELVGARAEDLGRGIERFRDRIIARLRHRRIPSRVIGRILGMHHTTVQRRLGRLAPASCPLPSSVVHTTRSIAMSTSQRNWISLGAAAEKLGIDRHAVHRLAEAGHLTSRHLPGTHMRVWGPDVDRLAERSTLHARPA